MTAVGSTLDSIFHDHLTQQPDATMLIQDGHRITYREFDRMSDQMAAWLSLRGIVAGDRVAVWLVNRVEWLALLFGLGRLGATLVSVNTKYRSHELQYILSMSQARMLILQHNFRKIDFADVLRGLDVTALPALQELAILDDDGFDPGTLLGLPAHRIVLPQGTHYSRADQPDAPMVFFTTSGTTKGPKLVMHTQATLSGHARHVCKGYGFGDPGDKLLTALPLCGVFGMNSALGAMHAGMPIVLMDVFDATQTARLLKQHAITHIFGSDEMIRRVLEATPDEEVPYPSLRLFGFASFSPGYLELANELIPRGFPLRGLYGSSEVHALFSIQEPGLPVEERVLGGGMPAARGLAHVRCRDPESGQLCPPGVSGEIEIASPTLFVGYYNNPEATASAFTSDGYFRTGDLGYVRQDGSFVYQTRMGDTLRLGGFLVDPSEIEQVLSEQPGVKDAQVVGVQIDGQPKPVAFVIAEKTAQDSIELKRLVATKLAAFKVPVRIWFVDAFPATASANGLKFQRTKMREMAMEHLRQETS